MGTFSVGQATRENFSIIGNYRAIRDWFGWRVRAIDRSALVLVAEGILAAVCYVLAVALAAPERGAAWTIEVFRATLGIAVAIPLVLSAAMRLHRRSLRHAGAIDLISVAKVAWLSGIFFTAVICWEFPRLDIPPGVFLLNAALLQIAWGALHFAPRAFRVQKATTRATGKRAVIIGAGDAGMAVLKELALDEDSPSRPVALVDDDPQKWGRTCCGVPVSGGIKELTRIAAAHMADEILVCIPSATHVQMHDILDAARRSNLPVRSLPSLNELMRGTNRGAVSRRDLRSPRIEELLQRDEVAIDVSETRKVVCEKVVLVTGAGGSIGSELCHQIAGAGPQQLLLVDKSENSLFYVHRELTERFGNLRVQPILADVTDRDRITRFMRAEKPELVFHAAAYKHVAMLERHPDEAIHNNVVGTRNMADAAIECGAARFINISTDKAVAPRNYMGLSKRITELCVQELSRAPGTKLSNVRFGNVAGSTGSVLRLFWDQIQKGGPVRITDPRATRYFMSVSEAVHLILRAAALGGGGETFVFDMGAPLNICELARTVMLFAGLKPEVDIPIEFIGLQAGEKLNEELWESWEQPAPTESQRILAIRADDWRARGILTRIRRMEDLLARGENDQLLQYLHQSYPDFYATRPAAGPRLTSASSGYAAKTSAPVPAAAHLAGAA
jgi:FlaA1/EpsC-like NDP-sugar epimerase